MEIVNDYHMENWTLMDNEVDHKLPTCCGMSDNNNHRIHALSSC